MTGTRISYHPFHLNDQDLKDIRQAAVTGIDDGNAKQFPTVMRYVDSCIHVIPPGVVISYSFMKLRRAHRFPVDLFVAKRAYRLTVSLQKPRKVENQRLGFPHPDIMHVMERIYGQDMKNCYFAAPHHPHALGKNWTAYMFVDTEGDTVRPASAGDISMDLEVRLRFGIRSGLAFTPKEQKFLERFLPSPQALPR